ncbi:carbohydrate porin [Chelatococcus reniformis]|uniref:Porin n=1 Tax=Chelatococcus reniformis TaxID=1494448 RepID=A0A916UEG0_9HYPH|nr:carbohydrate porin [Chelatococcus reniformis]GGC68914.1 porin [Chelatococcus reniformis]
MRFTTTVMLAGLCACAVQPAKAQAAAQPAAERPVGYPQDPPSVGPALGAWGDIGGSRTWLWGRGINYNLSYIGDFLGNPTGGIRQGGAYDGSIQFSLDADLAKLAGWSGATLRASAFNIQGKGLTSNVGSLMTITNAEATPTWRLFEFWVEQSFLDQKMSLRVGQLAIDSVFWVSQNAGLFISGTFGWPTINGIDMPAGAPAYPLAGPAALWRWTASDNLTVSAGIYTGDPAGNSCLQDNPQNCNRYGMPRFAGTLAIAEATYSYGDAKDLASLPGTIKLGAWYNSNRFDNLRIAADGLPLADPASDGIARRNRGDWGVYGVLDQTVYRLPGSESGGVGIFMRGGVSPGSHNLINFYVDAGVSLNGLIASRPNDTFGVAVAYAGISPDAQLADRDTFYFTGTYTPTRRYEALIEATYQAQIAPGWTIQPDIQYVINPGGRTLNPYDPAQLIKNALIVGVRTSIRY